MFVTEAFSDWVKTGCAVVCESKPTCVNPLSVSTFKAGKKD